MTTISGPVKALMVRLKAFREAAGLTPEQIEERLILGPGWVASFEAGKTTPTIGMILAILSLFGKNINDLVRDLPTQEPAQQLERQVNAEAKGENLLIRFSYADHDAAYELPKARVQEFDQVLKALRDGLSRLANPTDGGQAIKTDAVANAFLKAVRLWPHGNPSDLWWFVISRAYCDPYNHPAKFARMDFSQSWKRTGGWALEEVLVRHYSPFLKTKGINLFIAASETKENLLKTVFVDERLEAAKADVLLTTGAGKNERLLGVVHVKASFAERRTDDVPMSRALIRAGYVSPLWTMDCKSMPAPQPQNRGELGVVLFATNDGRSAKRKDIEDDGYFSACFSYNHRTAPTPADQKSKAKITVCNFRNPDDEFSAFIVRECRRILKK